MTSEPQQQWSEESKLKWRQFTSNLQYIFYSLIMIFGLALCCRISIIQGDPTLRFGQMLYSMYLLVLTIIGTYLTIFSTPSRDRLIRGFGILAFSMLNDKLSSWIVEFANSNATYAGGMLSFSLLAWLVSSIMLGLNMSKLGEPNAWNKWNNNDP